MSDSPPANRRRHERVPMLMKVAYRDNKTLLTDYLTDVGEGGLFIRTDANFQLGEKLSFAISFPGLVEPMALLGTVRWRITQQESRPDAPAGVGVEFRFLDDATRQRVLTMMASLRRAPASNAGQFRVLLVEDNPFTQDMFRHAIERFHRDMLNGGSLDLQVVANGPEALQAVGEANIDLALVDFFLPLLSGSDIVRAIRAQPKLADIPVLMVSAGGPGVREAAQEAGADLYLEKPVLLRQLLGTLRALIGKQGTDVAAPPAQQEQRPQPEG